MKICVVNPLSSGSCLIEALKDYGAEIFVALDERFVKIYDNYDLAFKTNDELIAGVKVSGCELVLAGSEFAIPNVDAVTAALNMKGNASETAVCRTNKVDMLSRIQALGLDSAGFKLVKSVSELPNYDEGAFPVFIKPVNSAGSDGCFRCNDINSLKSRVESLVNAKNLLGNINTKVMVQEYIQGQQYVVNTVSLDSNHVYGDIFEVNLEEVDGIPIYREISATDIDYNKGVSKDIIKYVSSCLDALGVKNGAAHTEVRVTESGVKLIEVNFRLMGPDLYIDAFSFGVGYSQASLWAESIFEPEQFLARVNVSKPKKMNFAMVYLRGDKAGTVTSRINLSKMRRLPAFHSLRQIPPLGYVTENPKLTTGDFGIAYIAHDSKDVFENTLKRLKSLEHDGLYGIRD